MRTYAIVHLPSGDVVNRIEYPNDPVNPPPGFDKNYIAIQNDAAGPGWVFDAASKSLSPPPAPPLVIPELPSSRIENA